MLSTKRRRIFKQFSDLLADYAAQNNIFFTELTVFAVPSSERNGIILYPVQDSFVKREKYGEIRALQVGVTYYERRAAMGLYENVCLQVQRIAHDSLLQPLVLDVEEQDVKWEVYEPDLYALTMTFRFVYLDTTYRAAAWL